MIPRKQQSLFQTQHQRKDHSSQFQNSIIPNAKTNISNIYPTINIQNQKKTNHNFTVAVRVKPLLNTETEDNKKQTINFIKYPTNTQQTLLLQYPKTHSQSYISSKTKKYLVNNVYIDESNATIYKNLIKPKIQTLKSNYNFTVLTYGITGSGKTHTIFGNKQNKQDGIAMMFIEDVIKDYRQDIHVKFAFSYLQIYNQQIYDLLVQPVDNDENHNITDDNIRPKMTPLAIRQDSTGKINIPDLSKIAITSKQQISKLIQKGNIIRACSSNYINKFSSRSHALLQLFCYHQKTCIQNTITIIDLAGSQRHVNNINYGARVREKSITKQHKSLQKQGSNINKSLLALGNCLKALEEGSSHVPYRDSKLTRILKDDLSGKAHNIMIACIGRNYSQAQETLNTLNYASRASKIRVQTTKNQCINDSYQCPHCLKLTPWKKIISKFPQTYLQKYFTQKQKSSKIKNNCNNKIFDQHSKIQIQICQEFQKFKSQIFSFIYHPMEFNQSSYQSFNLQCNQFMNTQYLFPQSNFQGYHKQITTIDNKNSFTSISNIFNIYKERITQLLHPQKQYPRSLSSSEQHLPKQVKKLTRAISQNKKKQPYNKQQTQPKHKYHQLIINQNLQTFRSEFNSNLQQNSINFRRSIPKNIINNTDTTNSTLKDIRNQSLKTKTKRMNPDTDIYPNLVSKISCKDMIIQKLKNARIKCIPDIHYTHQNCPKFEFEDQDFRQQKSLKINIKNNYSGNNNREDDSVQVSSFMEDDQLGNCY